jgi:hypothetical protein
MSIINYANRREISFKIVYYSAGVVRLFAKEASIAIGAVLAGARQRPHRIDELAGPLTLTMAPGRTMFRERSA